MNLQDFHSILDFAIEREEEAAAYYRKLANTPSFAPWQQQLNKLATIEEGHRNRLMDMKAKPIQDYELTPVQTLNTADYLIQKDITQPPSNETLLLVAMQREQKSLELYNLLASQVTNPELAKAFKLLANEEAGHKLHFEQLYNKLNEGE